MNDQVESEILYKLFTVHFDIVLDACRSTLDHISKYSVSCTLVIELAFLLSIIYGLHLCKCLSSLKEWFPSLNYLSDDNILNENWDQCTSLAACYAIQGARNEMEDRFFLVEKESRGKLLRVYGVLDGHGGQTVVEMAKHYFSTTFLDRLIDFQSMSDCGQIIEAKNSLDYPKFIRNEILELDEFLKRKLNNFTYVGSTVVLAIINGNDDLIVANVGDSRAVMCNYRNEAIPLSSDHKPNHRRELKRIRANNGQVVFDGVWRVSGILALSRALGDFPLKSKKVLIADPDVKSFDLQQCRPSFIVLATDGLWDVFDSQQAVSFIRQRLGEKHFGAKTATLEAFKNGSTDNITTLVVKF